MQKIAHRIREVRQKLGLSQEEMAARMLGSRSQISLLERGKTEITPRFLKELEILEKVASIPAQISSSTQKSQEGSPFSTQTNAKVRPVEIAPKMMRQIPVYSKVMAGEAIEFDGLPTRWEHTIEYDGKDEKAFALEVEGDSMTPNFPPGTIITIEPKYPPHNGQLVVAKIKGEGFLFKRYHHTGDFKKVTLSSYNPVYPPLELAREDLHWIYRVARATQNL